MLSRTGILILLIAAHCSNAAAQRVISTDAFVTELIFALGQQDALIAIDVTSQVPEPYKALPNIGYHRALSAEGLLQLSPTIVIGSDHIGPPNVKHALKAAAIPLLELTPARTPDGVITNITRVAEALEQAVHTEPVIASIRRMLKHIAERDLKGLRVAFLLAMDPHKLRLAGSSTSGDALISLMGATNVGQFENYQNVSSESLMAIDPDLILVAGSETETSAAELLNRHPILTHSKAGKTNNILSVDGSSLVAGLSISAIAEAQRIVSVLSKQSALARPVRVVH